MRLLRAIQAAWSFYRSAKYDDSAESGWTLEDERWLHHLFQTRQGKQLKARLTNYYLRSTSDAVRAKERAEWHCGRASGLGDMLVAIEQHYFSQVTAHSDESEEPQVQAVWDALESSA